MYRHSTWSDAAMDNSHLDVTSQAYLQVALSSLVADGAIQRMVYEQKLHDTLSKTAIVTITPPIY
jgi:hypothetical protein